MIHISYYQSPLGRITLASNNNVLIGLWFDKQKYYMKTITEEWIVTEDEMLIKTKKWLDDYFLGKNPSADNLKWNLIGTNFQVMVWMLLINIPYGKVITYKDLANRIAKKLNVSCMSAQAIGSAVSKNPIAIIIPCHRVVGQKNNLVGYAGGLIKKEKLLEMESTTIDNI